MLFLCLCLCEKLEVFSNDVTSSYYLTILYFAAPQICYVKLLHELLRV